METPGIPAFSVRVRFADGTTKDIKGVKARTTVTLKQE